MKKDDVLVETSIDSGGATWQEASNGGPTPGVNPSDDLSDRELLIRQTLTSENTLYTSELSYLEVFVESIPTQQFDHPA